MTLRLPLASGGTQPVRWTLGENDSGAFHGALPVELKQHTDDRYNIGLDGPPHAAQGEAGR